MFEDVSWVVASEDRECTVFVRPVDDAIEAVPPLNLDRHPGKGYEGADEHEAEHPGQLLWVRHSAYGIQCELSGYEVDDGYGSEHPKPDTAPVLHRIASMASHLNELSRRPWC
ncbi:hypothetical protein [Streptomyces canus]|uniref:hypothetical protein n=1 Tax=Streptomyces canus TaxID=58343 RepID=UPI0027D7E9D4|nr:hypothetical protein [Streptomyces canus]